MPSKQPEHELCLLCPQSLPTKRNVSLGALIPAHNESGRVHESCGDFAPGVFEVKGEYYFVGRSIARALDVTCSYKKCGGVSPTARCAVEECEKRYHLACAVADGCRRVDDGFKLYCREHRTFAPKRARKAAVCDEEEVDDDHAVICFECGNGGVLVCCDTCDRAVHQACAGLREVPEGDFSCAVCVKNVKQPSPKSMSCPDDDIVAVGAPSQCWSDATISPTRATPPRVIATGTVEKTEFPTPSPFRNVTNEGSQECTTPVRPDSKKSVQKSIFLTPSPFRNATQQVSHEQSKSKNNSQKKEFSTPSPFRSATQKCAEKRRMTKKSVIATPSSSSGVSSEKSNDLTDDIFNVDDTLSQPPVTPVTSSDAEVTSEKSRDPANNILNSDTTHGQPLVIPATPSEAGSLDGEGDDEEIDGMDAIFENDYTIGKPRISQSQSTPVKEYHCFQCNVKNSDDPLVPCDTCDRVIHSKCAGEAGIPIGDFSCSVCTGATELVVNSKQASSPSVKNQVEEVAKEKSPIVKVEIIESEPENSTDNCEKLTQTPRSRKRAATGEAKTPKKKRATTRKRTSPEPSPPSAKRRHSANSKASKTSTSFKWSKWSSVGTKRVSASQQPKSSQESTAPKWRPVLCATGLTNVQKEMLRTVASNKRTQVRSDFDGKVTHMIVNDSPTRTIKLCKAIAAGIPLLSFRYLEAAVDCADWPDVQEYEYELSQKRTKNALFDGMTFFFGVTEMKNELAAIVKLGGGTVLSRKPSSGTKNIDGVLYLVEDVGKKTSRRTSLKPLQQSMDNAQLIESKWILDRCMDSKQ